MSITRTISLLAIAASAAATCVAQAPATTTNAVKSAVSAKPQPAVAPKSQPTAKLQPTLPSKSQANAKPQPTPPSKSQSTAKTQPKLEAKPQPEPKLQKASATKPDASANKPAAGNAARSAALPMLQKTSATTPDLSAIKPVLPPAPVVDTHKYASRRDPFVNPIVRQSNDRSANCSTGKRCLVIGQLTLKGIIVADSGILAIVENAATRTYFLRVNDPLFDGVVERITRDSITFRENVSDSLGRPLGSREVVKKIVAPAA